MQKRKNVITISKYSQEKNLEFAMDVMSGINVDYNIIGNTKTKFNEVYCDNLTLKVNVKRSNSKIVLYKNIPRSNVVTQLDKAKVYFHAAPETFGITVVESIVDGCIPIVSDNSAHTEAVPFSELRYVSNDADDAQNKLKKAIAGDFDYLLENLKRLSENYNKENFKKNFINFVENIKS
ncbi:MAG: glycosyltransferase [Thaumarchaeota archaeon]|nr:glycosyltransferase [Nitrososphaerota archaeon]